MYILIEQLMRYGTRKIQQNTFVNKTLKNYSIV